MINSDLLPEFNGSIPDFIKETDRLRSKTQDLDRSILQSDSCTLDYEEYSSIPGNRFCISHKGHSFECFYYKNTDGPLFVFFNGSKATTPPEFHRWSYMSKIPGHMLIIADPMYYEYPDDLLLGWYYGNESENYRFYLSDIVKSTLNILNKNPNDLILFASSAGGPAALEVSGMLPGSRVVAINPQIRLSDYSYAKTFETITGLDLNSCDKRNDALPLIKKVYHYSKTYCLLIMNLRSTEDMEQLARICKSLNIAPKYGLNDYGALKLWIYDADGGKGVQNPHSSQEFYPLESLIFQMMCNFNDTSYWKNTESNILLINELWYSYYNRIAILSNEIPNPEMVVTCRENNKTNVIWGSGIIASELCKNILMTESKNPYMINRVIDSDPEKSGKTFYGLTIYPPGFVTDYRGLFIIIAIKNMDHIARILQNKGLVYKKDFIHYTDLYF